jgi:hypothetical protein
LTKESDVILAKILADLERVLGKKLGSLPRQDETERALKRLGLTSSEVEGWLHSEPDFQPRRPPDKLPVYPGGGWVDL